MSHGVMELHLLEKINKSREFWNSKLSRELFDKIVMYDGRPMNEWEKAEIHFTLDKALSEKVLRISGNADLLTYVVMLSALQVQFYRYANRNFIIHVPIYQKNDAPSLSDNICVPLISQLTDGMQGREVISSCKNELMEAYKNQHYSLDEIVKAIDPEEGILTISQLSVRMDNFHSKQITEKIMDAAPNHIHFGIEKKDQDIHLQITYPSKLFKRETITRLVTGYFQMLEQMISDVKAKVCEFDLVSVAETKQIVDHFNDTKREYPRHKTISEVFEAEAEKSGERAAIVSGGRKFTYRELNQHANRLARVLRKKGITRDSIVAILCDKSVETVMAKLAVIKAGGAYLPIDKDYPEARIRYMLTDSGSTILVGKHIWTDQLNLEGINVEHVGPDGEEVQAESPENLEPVNQQEDLAYVIYTSGTTGNPKGVCIAHRSVIKNAKNTDYIDVKEDDRCLQAGSLSFDAAVLPTWIALLNGIPLHMEDDELTMNFPALEQYMLENRITLTVLPTTLFNQFSQERIDAFQHIRYVIAGGDVISSQQVSRLLKRFESINVVNGYGPTENTVISTAYLITGEWNEEKAVPIGKPVSNSTAYIMDKHNKLLPVGIPGELCVGGDGVARGYLNHQELTDEKFVHNLYVAGERIYKTGDLARWLADGNLEFLGRIDQQVKIRGYRIELGEIEKQLTKHPQVKEAVVIDRKDDSGVSYLCGYLVGDGELSVAEVKEHLHRELPDYMVPAYLVTLEKLPLTPNGKIDKRALPKPDLASQSAEYITPRNEIEEKLAMLWRELLSHQQIGVKDNFFDLGGHSLKAVSLISRINKVFDVNISVSRIFEEPSIEKLAEYIEEKKTSREQGDTQAYGEIEPLAPMKYYPTSAVQKRMFAIHQVDPDSRNYNMPCVFQVKGNLSVAKWENVLKQLIARHESLRTSFHVIEEEVMQHVHDHVDFAIESFQVTGKLEDKKSDIDRIIDSFIRSFALDQAPLMRCGLVQLADANVLLLDFHHIITDGISMGIFMKELQALYEEKELVPLNIQYKDFASWQNRQLASGMMKKQESYWLQQFGDEVPVLDLPTDFKRSNVQNLRGENVTFRLEKELSKEIKRVLKSTSTTKYMFYLAVFNILLSKYSMQEDIVIGSPMAGRTHAILENVMGMFVNTLAMRNKPCADKTFSQFLQEVKGNAIRSFENQDYELQMLLEKVKIKKEKNRNLLFNVLFSVENFEEDEFCLGDLSLTRYDSAYDICKFDISLDVFQDALDEKEVVLNFNYHTGLYRKETIERFASHFVQVIKVVVADIGITLKDIGIVTGSEQCLVHQFNHKNTGQWKEKTLHTLFEQQAARTPDQIAVTDETASLTYRELNEKANSLAWLLRKKGVMREKIVAIMTDRSIFMVVGMLAVIKAGGAYLPIDPDYPEERINFMLTDSKADLLLTQKGLMDGLCFEGEVMEIDDPCVYENPVGNLENINEEHDLIYVIYTSGTTGKPKAVMVEHRNLVNIAESWIRDYRLDEIEVRLLQMASFSFDVATGDVCRALLSGGQMTICPKDARVDPLGLYNLIQQNKISIFESTPGLILAFMEYVHDNHLSLDSLKVLILGSDICSVEDFNKLQERFGSQIRIINSFGITETTIDSSFFEWKEGEEIATANVPIGKPMQNTQFYVLDRHLQLVPIGVCGELYIGGHGVTRGYLNNDLLTKERFIENPWEQGARLYKTGDMARWLPDGNVELIGRMDNQVKIRGYRIELGEIENQLVKHENVKEAVVVVKKHVNGTSDLIGFVTGDGKLSESELLQYLRQELPDYMVPRTVIQLDQMPLTPNAKIDRKQLSEMEVDWETTEYVAPRNETEEKLAIIWSEVLGIEKVGIKDHFFDLGGHSLNAIKMVSQICKAFQIELKIADLFNHPSIEELSGFLIHDKHQTGETAPAFKEIKPVGKQEYYAASSVQKRMYAINQLDTESTNYNMPDVFVVKGTLEWMRLENVLKELVKRHESFRTSFHVINGEIVQKVHDDVEFSLEYQLMNGSFAERKVAVEQQIHHFVKAFDLSKAPLMRAGIIGLEDVSILIIDTHHIIGDGISTEIVLSELADLYHGKELEEVPIQYKDFASWQNALYTTGAIQKQEDYWLNRFEGEIPVLHMPTDEKRPSNQSFEGGVCHFEIEPELAAEINRVIKQTGVTKYMFFLAAYHILLSKYSSQDDIVIGSPTVGRTHESLYRTVGMFLNTLPMRNVAAPDKSFQEFLAEIKENVLGAFENQDYDLEKLIARLKLKYDSSRNPLFDVMFTLQNAAKSEMTLGEATLLCYMRDHNTAKFDLSLFIFADDTHNEISGMLEYKTDLYKRETIGRLIGHYKQIMKQIVNNVGTPLSEISLITKEEKETILNRFNHAWVEHPRHITLKDLFEQQAERTPHHVAVLDKKERITYETLNRKANQLAGLLREKGVMPGDAVGILMDRSVDTIIAVIAVIKSGGACLPISPEYPQNRVNHMIEDSGAAIILTHHTYKDRLACDSQREWICLDDKELWDREPVFSYNGSNSVDELSYIIYTSGTTGKPKGVMQTHKTLINLVHDHYQRTTIDFSGKVIQFAAIGFDVFFQEVFSALLRGGQLCIINDEDKKDVKTLYQFITEHQVEVVYLPTAYLKFIFANRIYSETFPRQVKHIITAGEALVVSDLLKKFLRDSNALLHNHYGPSETHVTTTSVVEPEKEIPSIPPIGKPIGNTSLYILDRVLQLQPVGVPGEIYIAGDCLARGYLNNESFTNEKFIENPFVPGERMYKTGDLGKWRADGTAEYLGRIDHQVKIRGYRVEIAEIQEQIMSCQGIQEAVVLVRESQNNTQLCAFYIADEEVSSKSLKEYLAKELPGYMVPASFIQVDKMPLTANGKVDRTKLLEMDVPRLEENEFAAAHTETEKKVEKIWRKVLAVDKIGLHDNFFDIGGNSILVLGMLSHIDSLYQDRVRVADIFAHPTIHKLAECIDARGANEASPSITLKGIPMPQSYFTDERSAIEGETFAFEVTGNVYEKLVKIAKKERTTIEGILLSVQAFVLNKVFEAEIVTLYTIDGRNKTILPIECNFSSLDNFTTLFEITRTKLEEGVHQKEYAIARFEHMRKADESVIASLYNKANLAESRAKQVFDIAIEVEMKNHSVALECSCNLEKLNERKVRELFDAFIRTMNMVIQRY
ncbi:amino acid adenylation domain-containing protein [Brevibacillus sp. SYSU BS000544]|uniref:non-ribosomal peptide synthetase n=1 Tax=Brevibacillus sp. SYSU BS000544 TaxID=3416443 RepID=UPI003CE4B1DA